MFIWSITTFPSNPIIYPNPTSNYNETKRKSIKKKKKET